MTRRRNDAESGKVSFGCLLSLALLVLGVYVGMEFFAVRFRYYQMQDEVQTQASFAPAIDDITIRRRLVAKADSLGVPLGPRDWDIRRAREPRGIDIKGVYVDSVVLKFPGFRKVFYFTFTPSAHELY